LVYRELRRLAAHYMRGEVKQSGFPEELIEELITE
jgi:hypothetical protein